MNNDIFICKNKLNEPDLFRFETHAHDKWEFVFVIKGNPICMTEGRKYSINEKTLLAFRPAQIHRLQEYSNSPYEYFSLMCCESVFTPNTLKTLSNSNGFFIFENPELIYQKFLELYQEFEKTCTADSLRTRLFLLEILFCSVFENMQKDIIPTLRFEDPIVRAAASYIDANVHTVKRADQLGEALHMPKHRFYAHFTHSMLISPMKYVWLKRANLLKTVFYDEQSRKEALVCYGFKNEEDFLEELSTFCRSKS